MKIVVSIPGLAKTIPMSSYVPNALRNLGHEVWVFDHEYNNFLEKVHYKVSKAGFNSLRNNKLLDLIKKIKPDLFISIYGIPHTEILINQIKELGVITACWWLNDPFHLPFLETMGINAYNHVFSNSKFTNAIYHENGVKHKHFLPVGIDPSIHTKLDCPKIYDVFFAGDYHPTRERLILKLINSGINVAIAGPWKRKISSKSILNDHILKKGFFTPSEMVGYFNASKIVLNIHTWMSTFEYGVNPRLFESLGCGSFQICDFKKEIPFFLKEEEEIILFRQEDELVEKVNYYLKDDNERIRISNNAHNLRLSHTYENRMKELIQVSLS